MADTATDQLLRVPPGQLVIDDNIRKTVKLDPDFVKSIKQHGVLVPILVTAGDGDTYKVTDGQLRVLAALDTGRADVPIVVEAEKDTAARLIEQLVVNDHRSGVIDADRAAAYQTLFDLGVSADTLARKTNVPKKRVETALAVAGSKYASEVLDAGNVTLEQAAAIVEFEEDVELAEQLGTIALENPSRFDHALAQARSIREAARIHADTVAQLEAEGYTITDEIDYYHEANGTIARIDALYLDAERKTPLANTPKERIPHREGLKAVLDDGFQWVSGGDRKPVTEVRFYVDGWAEQGLHIDPYYLKQSTAAGGGLTDEEKEKRRQTRDNNKLWGPATEVRRTWIKELLQRKDLPAGWELFVAKFVASQNANDYRSANMLPDLLQWNQDELRRYSRTEYLDKNPTRAAHYLIGAAIAAVEGEYEFAKKGWASSSAPAYLAQLSKWGYTLSDLEETVAKKARS